MEEMSAEEKIEMSREDEKARISEPKQEVQCIVSSFYKYYIVPSNISIVKPPG